MTPEEYKVYAALTVGSKDFFGLALYTGIEQPQLKEILEQMLEDGRVVKRGGQKGSEVFGLPDQDPDTLIR